MATYKGLSKTVNIKTVGDLRKFIDGKPDSMQVRFGIHESVNITEMQKMKQYPSRDFDGRSKPFISIEEGLDD